MPIDDDPEFDAFAEAWLKDVAPHLRASSHVMAIAPDGGKADVKQALEIGYAILMDKPLIIVAPDGRHGHEKLLRIADHVITGDVSTPAGREAINEQLARVLKQ